MLKSVKPSRELVRQDWLAMVARKGTSGPLFAVPTADAPPTSFSSRRALTTYYKRMYLPTHAIALCKARS